METFSALLALCEGNPSVTAGFPSQRPVARSFDLFLDLRMKKTVEQNNPYPGNLRRHRAHFDITVMLKRASREVDTSQDYTYLILSKQCTGVESPATGFTIQETDSTNLGLNKMGTILQTDFQFQFRAIKLLCFDSFWTDFCRTRPINIWWAWI